MSTAPAVTAQDLELEHAELLPARETLLVPRAPPAPVSVGTPAPQPGGSLSHLGRYRESRLHQG